MMPRLRSAMNRRAGKSQRDLTVTPLQGGG